MSAAIPLTVEDPGTLDSGTLDSGLTVAVFVDPVESAKAAGLRYVTDDEPGIRRRKSGKGFTFLDAQGKTVKDSKVIERIKKLAIPPAWTDVWICPRANGHLQATAATPGGASSTATTPTGAACATRRSSDA